MVSRLDGCQDLPDAMRMEKRGDGDGDFVEIALLEFEKIAIVIFSRQAIRGAGDISPGQKGHLRYAYTKAIAQDLDDGVIGDVRFFQHRVLRSTTILPQLILEIVQLFDDQIARLH